MIKNYYVLLLLILLSVAKSNKMSFKNLRHLQDKPTVKFKEGKNLKNEGNKLSFDIILETNPNLSSTSHSITILYKGEKKTASCTYSASDLKLSCEYNCEQPYYGSIKIPRTNDASNSDTLSFNLSSEKILQQTVQLTYKNAVMELNSEKTSYNVQIYLDDSTNLPNNSELELTLEVGSGDKKVDCTYDSTSKILNCPVSGGQSNKIKFITDQKDGSIKWTNAKFDDKSINVKILAGGYIYGYDLDYASGKWTFKIKVNRSNIMWAGYYYNMNIKLVNTANAETTVKALCARSAVYDHQCEISEGIEGSQSSDLVYISNVQTGADLSFEDNILNDKKSMVRLITIKYVNAYELKYESSNGSSKWKFKIEVEEDTTSIVRDGLNVTVALFTSSNNYETASCLGNNEGGKKILSCERDKGAQYVDDLLELVFAKSVGSVTWSNRDSSLKTKIPFEIDLTHVISYYLAYEDSKWVFKMIAKPSNTKIHGKNLVNIPILYDTNQNTIAKCEGQSDYSVNKGANITFTCECSTLDNSKTFQINNNRGEGSVTWSSLSQPATIEKRIEFKFLEAYNMKFSSVSSTNQIWYFDIKFEDPKNIGPQPSRAYTIYVRFKDGTTYSKKETICSVPAAGSNIFNCQFKSTASAATAKNYLLFMMPTTEVNENIINWIGGGLSEYPQIYLNPELTFVKGTLNYNYKWIINIDVEVQSASMPVGSKVIIDITKDGSNDITMECIAETNSLQCDTTTTAESAGSLPSYTLKKTDSASTVTWKNTETDSSYYYFYLNTKLDFNSAHHLSFSDNKWQFNLDTSTFPAKNIIIIDVLYGNAASTAKCVKETTEILCIVDIDSQDQNSLVKIYKEKSSKSTVTWNNVNENKDIIVYTSLNVESVKQLSYKSSKKWEFKMNLINYNLPINSAVKIDLKYTKSGTTTDETATCTLKSVNILTCVPDVATQSNTDTMTISFDQKSGSVTYANSQGNLIIQESKELTFLKVNDLTIENNKWQFRVHLSQTNLVNGNSIEIDVKLNGNIRKSSCVLNNSILTCTLDKVSNTDRIILINNEDNQNIVWSNLENEIELYVLYAIEFNNCYGGFYENKWKFNLKYTSISSTIDAIGNYASLDILVDNQQSLAICKITQKFLECESQHETQTKDDEVKLYGHTNLGSVSFSNDLQEEKKIIQPISISLEFSEISNTDYSNDFIKFKIKGNLKDNKETEIAEKTITGVQIILTKKEGTKATLDAICLTNAINNSPVELSCEANGTVNETEDNIDIKVGSDGKSNFITFYSIKDNIEILSQKEESKTQESTSDNQQKNGGFMMNISYIFLFGVILLF